MTTAPGTPSKSTTNIDPRRDLPEAQDRLWREENRESIAAYNQHIQEHGAFSDGSWKL